MRIDISDLIEGFYDQLSRDPKKELEISSANDHLFIRPTLNGYHFCWDGGKSQFDDGLIDQWKGLSLYDNGYDFVYNDVFRVPYGTVSIDYSYQPESPTDHSQSHCLYVRGKVTLPKKEYSRNFMRWYASQESWHMRSGTKIDIKEKNPLIPIEITRNETEWYVDIGHDAIGNLTLPDDGGDYRQIVSEILSKF